MERCWAEDPQQRPSFSEVLRELQGMSRALKERRRQRRAAGGEGGGEEAPPGAAPP